MTFPLNRILSITSLVSQVNLRTHNSTYAKHRLRSADLEWEINMKAVLLFSIFVILFYHKNVIFL